VCQEDCFPERLGSTEGHEIRAVDVLIHIGHEDDRIASKLPRGYGGREITEEGQARADGITKGLQMSLPLGVNSLEAVLFSHPRATTTDYADAVAGAALEVEP